MNETQLPDATLCKIVDGCFWSSIASNDEPETQGKLKMYPRHKCKQAEGDDNISWVRNFDVVGD